MIASRAYLQQGDVLWPPRIKQRCLYLRVQGLFTLRKVLLMQLFVALDLHSGCDSQLNTNEMFYIDISRWMIRSRCRWISVYLPWRTSHAFEHLLSFVSQLALRCIFNPINCPAMICLPRMAFLSSFGRDITSEHHGTPVHISTTVCLQFTFCFYFQLQSPLSLSLVFDPL